MARTRKHKASRVGTCIDQMQVRCAKSCCGRRGLDLVGRVLAASILLVLSVPRCAVADSLLLLNGTVYTPDNRHPQAHAILAVDGRIVFVGTTDQALRQAPPGTRQIDLHGFTVLPGLTDSHAHLAGIGFRELSFNLEGTSSLAALKTRLRNRAKGIKGGQWITGRGWIESRWTPARFPTRTDLDDVVSDRPVSLERADGHATVVNSVALKLANIDRNTIDPAGGRILKDSVTGEPNGVLIDNAMDLIQHLIPAATDADTEKGLELAARRSIRLGWTQLQIAGNTYHEVDLLCRLYAAGRIKLRLYDAIYGPSADMQRLLVEGPSINRCGDRLTVRGIKLYIDGALGSRGAALLTPYSDAPDTTGLTVNTEATLLPILTAALRRGLQVETHAIGDRGNRIMLDLYEEAFAMVPVPERPIGNPRWRIEHAQILSPTDIPRFAQLGVIASMQPSHAISDLFFAPNRLGPERLRGAYAWRSLLDTGAIVVAGSDAPVEKGDPIIEFYAAVARRSTDGFAGANWHLEQRVSRSQALKMLSIWPAYAAFQENQRGSIEVGKLADFTVFSDDIMAVPESQILKSHVAMTIINGEVVYSNSLQTR